MTMQKLLKGYLSKGWKANLKMKKGSLRIPLLARITGYIERKYMGTTNESLRKPLLTINLSLGALMGSWDKESGTILGTIYFYNNQHLLRNQRNILNMRNTRDLGHLKVPRREGRCPLAPTRG